MEGYNKKVIMNYWTICRMKTTKKIYVKVRIIFFMESHERAVPVTAGFLHAHVEFYQ